MSTWKNDGKEKDIVLSSRIRLARNIKGLPFPVLLPDVKAKEVVELVEKSIMNNKTPISHKFNKIDIDKISPIYKRMLVEKHLTSPELGSNKHSAVFIQDNEEISVMVNEEDHIRIQCIKDSFQLYTAYEIANRIDDLLEENIRYAFNERYGYLTACPTNVGTGMRASVMLHLPSLTLTNQINNLIHTLAKLGLTIRGIYGEGSQALGDLYQISNQTTLGLNENAIISNLHSVAKEIIKKERQLRHEVLKNNQISLEDKIYRAYGVLNSARIISTEESMKLLSLVRLGADLKLINQVDLKTINNLMTAIQPGILSNIYGKELNESERDKIRAEHIRKELLKNT